MQCDMCGKITSLFRTEIEGTELNVCKDCGRHGKILGATKTKEDIMRENERIKEILEKKKTTVSIETNERIIDNCGAMIKQKREKLGLSQEEFAKKLNEKESMLHHIEQGKFQPSISLARKLERALSVKLVETVKDEVKLERVSSSGMTIGDILKNR